MSGCVMLSCADKYGRGGGRSDGVSTEPVAAAPPVAKRVSKGIVQHGEKRADNYFWLREKKDPEVIKYLEAENAYTAAIMKPAERLKEKLYAEILGRIKEDDQEVPWRKGPWVYYSKTEKGKQYPIHCRRPSDPLNGAGEHVILDINQLAQGKQYMDVGDQEVSDDGHLLAYTTDETGFREYTLRV
jgi:oligopeptidase B